MQDAALFYRSRAVACFHRRRRWPFLSDGWRHEVEDARRFIRATRANWDDRPREITRTHYALGPRVQMQKPLTRAERTFRRDPRHAAAGLHPEQQPRQAR